MRVLKWIIDRCQGKCDAAETLFGWVPQKGQLELSGLGISEEAMREVTSLKLDEWKAELESQQAFFESIGPRMPHTLELIRRQLLSRIR